MCIHIEIKSNGVIGGQLMLIRAKQTQICIIMQSIMGTIASRGQLTLNEIKSKGRDSLLPS